MNAGSCQSGAYKGFQKGWGRDFGKVVTTATRPWRGEGGQVYAGIVKKKN